MNPSLNPREVIQDCADSRALLNKEYTIETALTDARFYRSHPEIILDGRQAKRVIDTLLKALDGQQATVIDALLSAVERKGS